MLRLLSFILIVAGYSAWADECSFNEQTCIETGDVVVDGVTLHDVCIEAVRSETCIEPNPTNSCVGLERRVPIVIDPQSTEGSSGSNAIADGTCELKQEQCLQTLSGSCVRTEKIYQCWNGPENAGAAELVERRFVNFNEIITPDCEEYDDNPNCTLTGTTVLEGHETRLINALDVTRSWWRRERSFDCTPEGYTDTCGPLVNNQLCEQGDITCLHWNEEGRCVYREISFQCESGASFNASCEAINVCVGDNCEGIEQEASQDYPVAATWLNFLDKLSDNNTCDLDMVDPESGFDESDGISVDDCENDVFSGGHVEPEVFGGEFMACRRDISNCCSRDDLGCSAQEAELRYRRQAGATHFLFSRCTQRFLGICTRVHEYYCVYDSKFARVFQEQADLQTGIQFTSTPRCIALTIQQLEQLDITEMDLTEVFGDMLDQTEEPIEALVIDRLSEEMGVFQLDVEETMGGQGQ